MAVAVYSLNEEVIAALQRYHTIVYDANLDYERTVTYSFIDSPFIASSLSVLRYYLYHYWALMYSAHSLILLSDFRDVFFQSDPFAYNPNEWSRPSRFDLVVVQETFFMSIKQCGTNLMWLNLCYSPEEVQFIGSNTISCSGTTMGTRDGIVAYVRLECQ